MQFLKQFWKTLREFFHSTSNLQLSQKVAPDESLGRYLTSKSFSKQNNRVFSAAFMPRKDNLKLSVFRILGLSEDSIWRIGKKQVMKSLSADRTLYGRAEINVLEVLNRNLQVIPDKTPPARHANIIGWSQEQSERLLIATQLAENAKLVLRPVER